MAISREDYIKKFKKLSKLNESVVKPVSSMDGEDEVPFASGVVSPGVKPEERTTSTAFDPSNMLEAENAPEPNTPPTDELPMEPESQAPAGAGMDSSMPTSPASDSSQPAPADQADPNQPNPESISDPNVTMTGGSQESSTESQGGQDEIQNMLLKTQLSAIEKLSTKFDQIEAKLANLDSQMQQYSVEVEKVKEPDPMEKIGNRWQDSFPFKYTLNDLWDGNSFQNNQDMFPKDGIEQTKDGKYVADINNMGTLSDYEIKKSFNEEVQRLQKKINESLKKSPNRI